MNTECTVTWVFMFISNGIALISILLFCIKIFRHNNYFFTSDKWFHELFLVISIRIRIRIFVEPIKQILFFNAGIFNIFDLFLFYWIINICLNWWLKYSERTYHTFQKWALRSLSIQLPSNSTISNRCTFPTNL